MGTTSYVNDVGGGDALYAESLDTGNTAAVTAAQRAASGSGAALKVSSANTSTSAAMIQGTGAGALIDLKNAAGVSQFKLSNNGTLASPMPGSKAWMYQYLEPTGAKASTVDGRMSATSTAATLTTGTVYECALPIESGVSIANLTLASLTAEATGTHAWVGIADNTNKVLAISTDQTGAAYFAANSLITTAVTIDGTNPLVTAYTGLYYMFVCVVASGTMPTFASAPAFTHVAITTAAPIFCGSSLTAQTTPVAVASSLGTITPLAGMQIYAYAT